MSKSLKLLLCTAIVLSATACTLDEPTWVNSSRVEIHEEGFTDTFETSSLDAGMVRAIGVNYYRYGNGPMDVAVSYDPSSKTNTKATAENEINRLRKELDRNGVRNLRITSSPAERSGEISKTIVSFPALTARPPEDCTMMPGYNDAQTIVPENAEGHPKDYRIGCSIETLMAQQVSRPGDLLGRPGFETNADARRQEAVVWERGYYSNKAFEPIDGERASDTD